MLDENDINQLELIYQTNGNDINKRRLTTAIKHINMFESQVKNVKIILSDNNTSDRNKITRLFAYTDIMYSQRNIEFTQIN